MSPQVLLGFRFALYSLMECALKSIICSVFVFFLTSLANTAQAQSEAYLLYSDQQLFPGLFSYSMTTGQTRALPSSDGSYAEAYQAYGDRAFALTSSGKLVEWNVQTGAEVRSQLIPACYLNGRLICSRLAVSQNHIAAFIVSTHSLVLMDRGVVGLNPQTFVLGTYRLASQSQGHLKFSPDGNFLYVTFGIATVPAFPLQVREINLQSGVHSSVEIAHFYPANMVNSITDIQFWTTAGTTIAYVIANLQLPRHVYGAFDTAPVLTQVFSGARTHYGYPGLSLGQTHPNGNPMEWKGLSVEPATGLVTYVGKSKVTLYEPGSRTLYEDTVDPSLQELSQSAWTGAVFWATDGYQISRYNFRGQKQHLNIRQALGQPVEMHSHFGAHPLQARTVMMIVKDRSGDDFILEIRCPNAACASPSFTKSPNPINPGGLQVDYRLGRY